MSLTLITSKSGLARTLVAAQGLLRCGAWRAADICPSAIQALWLRQRGVDRVAGAGLSGAKQAPGYRVAAFQPRPLINLRWAMHEFLTAKKTASPVSWRLPPQSDSSRELRKRSLHVERMTVVPSVCHDGLNHIFVAFALKTGVQSCFCLLFFLCETTRHVKRCCD